MCKLSSQVLIEICGLLGLSGEMEHKVMLLNNDCISDINEFIGRETKCNQKELSI